MKEKILYTKDYFEEYARLCLNDLFNLELIFRNERYNEDRPDLISKDEKIGIEVTRGITEEDGRHDKLFQYDDYPKDQSRNEVIEKRAKKLKIKKSLKFIDGIATLNQSCDKKGTIIKIKESVASKLKDLNGIGYNVYESNRLFIFAAHIFSSDIEDIKFEILKLQEKFLLKYNTIYLLNTDEMYLIQKNQFDQIYLSSKKLKAFKINSKNFVLKNI